MKEWNSFDTITKGKGMWLIDSKGNKMLDGVASMWCNVWGHSNPELVKAITNQSKKLQHSFTFGDCIKRIPFFHLSIWVPNRTFQLIL